MLKAINSVLLFKGSYCCWLKSAVPKREPNEDATSGIIKRERYRHPPTGMRSAVPLGGLGTGSFELRADGKVQIFYSHRNIFPFPEHSRGLEYIDFRSYG